MINPSTVMKHHEEEGKNIILNPSQKSNIQSLIESVTMAEQLRQQLTILINAFVQQNNAVETCVGKIIELLHTEGHLPLKTNEPHGRRESIFDNALPTASRCSLSNTYHGQCLVKKPNIVLRNNRVFPMNFCSI
jgi:hypothetical protein